MTLRRAEQNKSLPIMAWSFRSEPWVKWLIASLCLGLGGRLLFYSGPVPLFVAAALLMRVPTYSYLGWCDYRAKQEARAGRSLGWLHLSECYASAAAADRTANRSVCA